MLYGVGILSGYEMKFSQNAGDAIAAAGFRADKAQGENYPSLSEYGRAERVDDAVEFAKQTENLSAFSNAECSEAVCIPLRNRLSISSWARLS